MNSETNPYAAPKGQPDAISSQSIERQYRGPLLYFGRQTKVSGVIVLKSGLLGGRAIWLYGAIHRGLTGLLSFKRVAGSPETLAQEAIKRGRKSYRTGGSPIPLVGHVSQKSIWLIR